MSLNKGKQYNKYHNFLGKEYRIDKLPCGISIPFNIELNKVRKNAVEIVDKLNPKTPESKLYFELMLYYTDHPEEAHKQMLQMIKAISVITEYMTDGEIDEDYIGHHAEDDDVKDFFDAIQDVEEEKVLKKYRKKN